MRTVITPKIDRYIRANRLKMSTREIALKNRINKFAVQYFLTAKKLKPSKKTISGFRTKASKGKTTCTKAQDRIIKARYLDTPVKTLATMIGKSHTCIVTRLRQLELKIPKRIIEQRKKDSRFHKGIIPTTKGKKWSEYMSEEGMKASRAMCYKKGNRPHNTKEKDGEISLRHNQQNNNEKPYYFIRISVGKWYPLHQLIWQQAYGIVPEGYCLWFKDSNTLNVTLNNLEMITRAENARRNRNKFINLPPELQEVIQLTNKLQKIIKNHKTA